MTDEKLKAEIENILAHTASCTSAVERNKAATAREAARDAADAEYQRTVLILAERQTEALESIVHLLRRR